MEPNVNSNSSTIIKVVASVVVLGLVGFAAAKVTNQETSASPSARTENATSTEPVVANTKYRNGTYSAVGNYNSPAGEETVEISLTLENDVVTAATFNGKAVNPTSIKNQGLFKAGFETLIVGKPIDSINLTVVNGSSLTPKGFAQALQKIQAQALVQA